MSDYEIYPDELMELRAEIERLTSDKMAISQTASDYLHEIERLEKEVQEVTSYAANAEIVRVRAEAALAILTSDPTPEMIEAGRFSDPLSCDASEEDIARIYTSIWNAMARQALGAKSVRNDENVENPNEIKQG